MSPGMQKMFISLSAIGLMGFASTLIMFARYRTKGIMKVILSFMAYLLLVPNFVYALFFLFFL
jgi:hypothetical protein